MTRYLTGWERQHLPAGSPAMRKASVFVVLALTLVGCQGQTSTEPPIVPIRNMHELPRYDTQEGSPYFRDGRAMRSPVEHTVPREMEIEPVIDTGTEDDGSYTLSLPERVVEEAGGAAALLERGQDRYQIFCVPCHGALGDGEGMVSRRSGVSAIRPPTFHDDRMRHMPDGQLFATIRNGVRAMPGYRHSVPVRDRWAIVFYVRALQLSQMDGRTASAEIGR